MDPLLKYPENILSGVYKWLDRYVGVYTKLKSQKHGMLKVLVLKQDCSYWKEVVEVVRRRNAL